MEIFQDRESKTDVRKLIDISLSTSALRKKVKYTIAKISY